MRNIYIVVCAIILVTIGYVLFKNNEELTSSSTSADVTATDSQSSPVIFRTNDQEFTITYLENADTAILGYGGSTYELERARSASGARYTSRDGSVVFWEHQGEAMIEIDGVTVVSGAKNSNEEQDTSVGYKDAEYVIEGKSIPLKDGYHESEIAPGSATRVITRYFGNELVTDLDGDGDDDVAFIVTQQTGGSGTFYYAVAALNTEDGYVGSDGYLLGDRVAPQATTLSPNPRHTDVVVFNYADRSPEEPMNTQPSVGKSVYLKIVPEARQWAIVEPDFEGESAL